MRSIFVALMILVAAAAACAQSGQQPGATEKKTNGGTVMSHELPPLPYDYDALEPYYDEETVRLHHDKHFAAYIKGLNTAEEKLAEARAAGDYSLIQHWERQLAFHGSGAHLHNIFFHNMAPNAGGEPHGSLAEQIVKDFGSYQNFKKQFSAAAINVEASGWAVMGWDPKYQKLYITAIENHQKQTVMGLQPLLVLDAWEHAYYLKYQNRRADWVEAWWNLVNWQDVSMRYADVLKGGTVTP